MTKIKELQRKGIEVRPKRKDRLNRKSKTEENLNQGFLEDTLKIAEIEFKNYEKGYKVFSLNLPNNLYSDKLISEITNSLTTNYDCRLNSLSLYQIPFSNRLYTFVFEKD